LAAVKLMTVQVNKVPLLHRLVWYGIIWCTRLQWQSLTYYILDHTRVCKIVNIKLYTRQRLR
jgi:hypothetical protein